MDEVDINSAQYRQHVLSLSHEESIAYIVQTQGVDEDTAQDILETYLGGDHPTVDESSDQEE